MDIATELFTAEVVTFLQARRPGDGKDQRHRDR
jgi:hypothetical protein